MKHTAYLEAWLNTDTMLVVAVGIYSENRMNRGRHVSLTIASVEDVTYHDASEWLKSIVPYSHAWALPLMEARQLPDAVPCSECGHQIGQRDPRWARGPGKAMCEPCGRAFHGRARG